MAGVAVGRRRSASHAGRVAAVRDLAGHVRATCWCSRVERRLAQTSTFFKKKEIIALFNCRMKKNEGIEKTIF